MDPTLVPGTRFESQFQICVYEHAILRIYISFFSNSSEFKLFLQNIHVKKNGVNAYVGAYSANLSL